MYLLKNKRSFTLMEVIVSIVIVALVFTLISSFLWLNFKISARAKNVSQDYYGIRNVLELMASDISSAFKFEYSDYNNIEIENGSSISFWYVKSDLSNKEAYSKPILRISYYTKELNGKKTLFKRLEDLFSDYSEDFIIYNADFNFLAITYNSADKSLIELEDYSEDEFPQAIKVEVSIEGETIEKRVFLLQDNRI